MKLTIKFFEAGKGDSTLLLFENGEEKHYGLIDCNAYLKNEEYYNPALEYLKANEVNRLAFLAVTHFHADHFFTIERLIQHCVEIGSIYVSPSIYYYVNYLKNDPEKAEKIKRSLKNLTQICAESPETDQVNSLGELLRFLKNRSEDVELHHGLSAQVFPAGFSPYVDIKIILPTPQMKSDLISFPDSMLIENLFQNYVANDYSLAFQIFFQGVSIIIGGDASAKLWTERKKRIKAALNSEIVRLPHHGSNQDNSQEVINYLIDEGNLYSVISANGKQKSPHKETLKRLSGKKTELFCTNKSVHCNAFATKNFKNLSKYNEHDVFQFYCWDFFDGDTPPCGGDITFEIENGKIGRHSSSSHCFFSKLGL